MLAIAPDGDVSWGAHVGGILAGAFLILVLRFGRVCRSSTGRSSRPAPSETTQALSPAIAA